MSNIVVNMCFWSLCIPLCHGWLNIEREQKVFVSLITSFHCALLLSPPSTQKTLQRFRSWPNTSLMSFWLRKTLKSRNYNRRIKVKKKNKKKTLFCWLYGWCFISYSPSWLSRQNYGCPLKNTSTRSSWSWVDTASRCSSWWWRRRSWTPNLCSASTRTTPKYDSCLHIFFKILSHL